MKSCLSFALAAGWSLGALAGAGPAKPAGIPVRVEVLPGITGKWIDPLLAERIPVAAFGAPTLDVRELDPASFVLAGAAVTKQDDGTLATYRDMDGDGLSVRTRRCFSSGGTRCT